MTRITFLVLLATTTFCLSACGYIYGPTKELEAYTAAKADVIDQWSKILKNDPTEGGVDQARKAFEAKKTDLAAKRAALSSAPQGFNGDWLVKKNQLESDERGILDAMERDLQNKGGDGPRAKFRKLQDDFWAVCK